MCYGLLAGPWLICERNGLKKYCWTWADLQKKKARKKYIWAWADLPKNGLVDLRKK
jgi:hypothetical protein